MQAVVAAPGEGERLWFGGGCMSLKVLTSDSDGVLGVLEDVAMRGKTTPLHLHETFDETFYVVTGELLLHIDGRESVAPAGSVAFVPRGVPHAFLVTSDEARFITIVTPSDVAENFYRAGGETPSDPDAAAPPLDIQKVLAAGETTGGMKVLGPPPFAAFSEARSASA